MADGPYLVLNPPRRSQYRRPRRKRLSGVIEVHTAEGVMDTVGPDTGAENVARFIRDRDTPGSYHDLVDSDSYVWMVDYDDEAYHDATGRNPHTTSVSFACRTTDWAKMSPERRHAFLDQGARRAAVQARHIHRRTGIVVPARRITRAQADAGEFGFLAHGDSDPGRRTDPGTTPPHLFPWDEFLALYRRHAADLLGGTPDTEDPIMADKLSPEVAAEIRTIVQQEVKAESMIQARWIVKTLTLGTLGRWAREGLAYARAHARALPGHSPQMIAEAADKTADAELAKARDEVG